MMGQLVGPRYLRADTIAARSYLISDSHYEHRHTSDLESDESISSPQAHYARASRIASRNFSEKAGISEGCLLVMRLSSATTSESTQ